MKSNYDWSNVDHIKKKMDYIRNTIILSHNTYDELPEIQKKDFDEYVEEYFNIKKAIVNHDFDESMEYDNISIFDKYYIIEVPANAASESLDFSIHPMIKEFYERLNEYSQELENDYDNSLSLSKKKKNSRGIAIIAIVLIATIILGIICGALLFFIK